MRWTCGGEARDFEREFDGAIAQQLRQSRGRDPRHSDPRPCLLSPQLLLSAISAVRSSACKAYEFPATRFAHRAPCLQGFLCFAHLVSCAGCGQLQRQAVPKLLGHLQHDEGLA